jgi:hypothetical protein
MENQLLKVPALICSVHVAPESADVQMEPPSTPAARFCSAGACINGEEDGRQRMMRVHDIYIHDWSSIRPRTSTQALPPLRVREACPLQA